MEGGRGLALHGGEWYFSELLSPAAQVYRHRGARGGGGGTMASWLGPLPALRDNVQKRLARFVLQRSIGQFLQHKLQLEQIDFSASDGRFQLEHLELNATVLNELLGDGPVIVRSGWAGRVQGHIPFLSLMNESCEFELEGITLNLQLRSVTEAAMAAAVAEGLDLARSIAMECQHDLQLSDHREEGMQDEAVHAVVSALSLGNGGSAKLGGGRRVEARASNLKNPVQRRRQRVPLSFAYYVSLFFLFYSGGRKRRSRESSSCPP